MPKAPQLVLAAVAPLLAGVVLAPPAAAPPVSTGAAAEATFISAEGCIVTDVALSASEATSYGPSKASVDILRHDKCVPRDPVAFIVGKLTLPEPAFVVDAQGARAVLHAVIPAQDYVTRAPVSLDVAVTWTAGSPGTSHRPAVAAGHILGQGRNFAPKSTRLAEIQLPRSAP